VPPLSTACWRPLTGRDCADDGLLGSKWQKQLNRFTDFGQFRVEYSTERYDPYTIFHSSFRELYSEKDFQKFPITTSHSHFHSRERELLP
jgi:hypothetical protein